MERINVKEMNDNIYGTLRIQHIFESRKNELWIGTHHGLYKYIHNRETFKRYLHDPNDSNSLSSSNIGYICEDKDGILWLGTLGGLNRFDPKSDTFTHYTKEDGLPSNRVQGILEDKDNNALWLSTYEGISRFDLSTKEFRNFDASHGLTGKRLTGSVLETKNGEFLFGGSNGLNIFHPDDLLSNLEPPDLIISDFKIFNISVPVGDDSPLQKPIYQTEKIVLASDEHDISFDFLTTHYVDPSQNEYAYMLENYENEWRYVGNTNSAIYPNLPPGEYIFRVKAANNIGVWNEEGVSIKIIILPPWWATTWAYIVYAIVFFIIIYFTWKIQLKRIRIKHNYEMTKFEAEKMREVDEMKSRFFANLSHEFRTPLTLIFGPAKDIMENSDDKKAKQNAGMIKRNASRLYKLVNQLLDLSKLEAGKLKLEASEYDIIPFLKGVVLSFSSLAERQRITLRFNTIEKTLSIYVDKDKVEKIVNNLLSNAFQFTPEGGEIDFTIEKLVEEIEIKIADNGIGIPKEKMNKIFNRFYQLDGSHTREGEGTGIGLALTKELVELHKGKIMVESKEGEGSIFTVLLPLGKKHLKPEEIVEKDVEEEELETIEEVEFISEPEMIKEKTDIDVLIDVEKPLLLIVEDNSDVRKYIISHLEEDYRIQEAVDGKDGLSQASNHIPDLIISDVMMPNLDGFELCNKLKTNEKTSHIPVIILTAKATSQDKIEGYETGADDYIMKPFEAGELKARIKNLIEMRRKLQEKFSSDDFIIPKELSSIDERFLNKVLNAINDHISEEKFSIEDLGNEVAMSRKHLHRKLKALTNKSPSQFIRSIRLSKARMLIKEKKGTISEISFMVGFSTPIYFNKCFKEEFGYSPGEVIG
jgi:signal transduction histidine kinase/DNA-binding response OmpR family regulator